ncbi:hypothetical protein PTTG_26089 [Puccinia triticina 1-1 BBBD Race 1]|uniref:Uncharacterized protein n=1 Tax=Puccinia triticina (isolate 1-1 / race 1 (BBBD)) TaxID=630390 RepID=A0A180GWN2_PUCT1|nr:hypothetical protein PTTG_26089 [Puccinia triticina 1-1 BBBD Race 1]
MLPGPSSKLCSNESILASPETGVTANSSGDEALEPYALHSDDSDDQDAPPNTPGTSIHAQAPKPPRSNIRPINPPETNSPGIIFMRETPDNHGEVEIRGPVNVDKIFGDGSSRAAALTNSCGAFIA